MMVLVLVLVLCYSIEMFFWGGGCCVSGVGDAASVGWGCCISGGGCCVNGGVLRQWRGAASVRRGITR